MMQSNLYLQISIKEQGFQHAPSSKRPSGKEWTCTGFETGVRFSGAHATEPSGVAAQHLPHHPRDGGVSGSQQHVEVVGH
jgi:hypothetical protein